MTPQRITLSRKKGFNLQAVSLALNGLPAVNVARPTEWGNPYRITADVTRHYTVSCFQDFLRTSPAFKERVKQHLIGKNLACWCKQSEECHADVLLEIANKP